MTYYYKCPVCGELSMQPFQHKHPPLYIKGGSWWIANPPKEKQPGGKYKVGWEDDWDIHQAERYILNLHPEAET